MEHILIVPFMLFLDIIMSLWQSAMITAVWNNFIIQLGFPEIGRLQAFCLCVLFLIVRGPTYTQAPKRDDGSPDYKAIITEYVGTMLIFQIYVWIAFWLK